MCENFLIENIKTEHFFNLFFVLGTKIKCFLVSELMASSTHKDLGDQAVKDKDYNIALGHYNRAINEDEPTAALYSNSNILNIFVSLSLAFWEKNVFFLEFEIKKKGFFLNAPVVKILK